MSRHPLDICGERIIAMSEQVDCLIVGAGPTGLTLGVGLRRAGKSVLIVEKHKTPLDFSKAILLNSESLASVWYIDRWNFFSFPQKGTESCLRDVFLEMGGRLMRGVTFNQVDANAANGGDGSLEVILHTDDTDFIVECDWLFGCDGVHSAVREALQIPFPGLSLPGKIYILDAIVKSWSLSTHVNVFLGDDSQFAILISTSPLTVRIIGTTRAACAETLEKFEVKQIIWDGSFTNSFRLADSYGHGRIWLAGDAAHVHSPVGGRGMNMGILDAVALASAVANNTISTYEETRRPAARTWVWCNYYLTQLFLSKSLVYKWLRKIISYGLVVLGYLLGPRLAMLMFQGMTNTQVKLRNEE